LNVVADKHEYLERLRIVLEQLHNCKAIHAASIPVHETSNGRTLWRGEVEVFNIVGNLRAKLCYAWSQREGENDEGERIVAVMEIPPVDSAAKAVRNHIVKEASGRAFPE
jgi:hypothetical protein